MDELARFEEKQKLTNLQIEKRFVQLEESFDELKTRLEKVSTLENIPEEKLDFEQHVKNLRDDVNRMKEERKKDLDQVSALADSVDVSGLKREFSEAKNEITAFKSRFEEELKAVRVLEDQILKTGNSEKIHDLFVKIKEITAKLDNINLRLTSLEKDKLQEPIFID